MPKYIVYVLKVAIEKVSRFLGPPLSIFAEKALMKHPLRASKRVEMFLLWKKEKA
jgi:hypothetical protein